MTGQPRTSERLPPNRTSIYRENYRRAVRETCALRSAALAMLSAEYATKMAIARREGGPALAARLAVLEEERCAKEQEIKLRIVAGQLLRRTGAVVPKASRPARARNTRRRQSSRRRHRHMERTP